jgi:hypothetical protein
VGIIFKVPTNNVDFDGKCTLSMGGENVIPT